jgi:hypothetical protein
MQGHPRPDSPTARLPLFGKGGAALRVAVALLGLLIFPNAVRANTYMFSFTGQQVLTALAGTDPNESTTGYFAIMVQPNIDFGQSISWGTRTAPTAPSPSEAWTSGTITDYSLGNSNPFVYFSKGQVQSSVAVLTNDPYFSSDMQGTYYNDNLTWPEGWGNSPGTIQDELPTTGSTGTFQFIVTTNQILGATDTVTGKAFGYYSQDNKTDINLSFSLTATVTPVTSTPEPETWGLLGSGAVLLTIGKYLKKNSLKKH